MLWSYINSIEAGYLHDLNYKIHNDSKNVFHMWHDLSLSHMWSEMSLRTPQRMHAHAHTHTHTHTHTQDLIQNFKLLGNSNLAVAKVQMKEWHQHVCRPRQTRSSKNFLSGWINSPYLGQLQISYLAVLIYPGLFLTLVGFVKYSLTVQKDIHWQVTFWI